MDKIHVEQEVPAESSEELEKQAESLYSHVKDIASLKYESELRREDSLIQQSSHMQTAFSFMTAAVFMAFPILIEHRGEISLDFFFWAGSTITIALLASLVLASLAQRRVLKKTFMNIPEIEQFVSDTYSDTLSRAAQIKQWVQVVGDVQVSLDDANNSRVKLIQWSLRCFFLAIGLIVVWYIIGLIILY